MSKSDRPLQNIKTDYAHKNFRKVRWLGDTDIVAMDFETNDGDPFMLSISEPGSEPCVMGSPGRTMDTSEIIDHLLNQRYSSGCIVVWFNLSFDAEVFFSGLPVEKVSELYYETETTIDHKGKEVTIRYIPGKIMTLTDEYGHKVEHYDVQNIVRGSLEDSANEWLEDTDGKANETIDVEKFDDQEYIRDNWGEISKYAKIDAELTRKIAERVYSLAEAQGIPCRKPVSTGSISQKWMADNLPSKPGWAFSWVHSFAWDSYAGGRFEVYERGDIGSVAGPDINSAYPAIMSELPDPGSLAWEHLGSEASVSDLRNADYGFARIEVTTDAERRIQPFAKKIDGKVTYPAFDSSETTALIPIILHALDAGLIKEIDVKSAAIGYETDATIYPFSFLKDTYNERKMLESDGKKLAGLMLKIVLNSAYGKTAQTTLKNTLISPDMDIDVTDPEIAEHEEIVSGANGNIMIRSQEAGSMFNPFIASYITGMTRLELHKAVLDHDLEDDTVMLATDCLMIRKDAFEASSFAEEKVKDGLGNWDYDYNGVAFVVGSGVYEVATANGLKQATRGFRESQIDSIRSSAHHGDMIMIEQSRPTTIGEAIAQGSDMKLHEVGKFTDHERELKPGFDTKREWERSDVSWDDLLDSAEYGSPITYSGD